MKILNSDGLIGKSPEERMGAFPVENRRRGEWEHDEFTSNMELKVRRSISGLQ